MIVYDLICSSCHEFEAWFKSADDYARQSQQGLLSCPVCGDVDINKKMSAINIVGQKSNQNTNQNDRNTDIKRAQIAASETVCESEGHRQTTSDKGVLRDGLDSGLVEQPANKNTAQRMISSDEVAVALRQFVKQNFDDVGNSFADEARKMHYGEADMRPIHGRASADEIADLSEEGIESVALPTVSATSKH